MPWEFHADTTKLIQMLRMGHHNVQLDRQDWDRLITWIDLNAPAHGTWAEARGAEPVRPQRQRRREMLNRYTSIDDDPEATYPPLQESIEAVMPDPEPVIPPLEIASADWPFEPDEALRRQTADGTQPATVTIQLDGETPLLVARIPAGQFVMGGTTGAATNVRPPLQRSTKHSGSVRSR